MARRSRMNPDLQVRDGMYYPTLSANALDRLPEVFGEDVTFVEPCAGRLHLACALQERGWRCVGAFDVEERGEPVECGLGLQIADTSDPGWVPPEADLIVTNPPWESEFLLATLPLWLRHAPVVMLGPGRYEHNVWFSPIMRGFVTHIIPCGRVRFIEGTDSAGKHDSSWYVMSPAKEPDRFPVVIPRHMTKGGEEYLRRIREEIGA